MHVSRIATGSGIGSLLMKQAIRFIKERKFKNVELGVITANSRARRFYEADGWELVKNFLMSSRAYQSTSRAYQSTSIAYISSTH
ncbi:MAG: GNAT family N-acetyltransferase, partial [Chloroflexi bacterium]|nr:GNAT family N-acetyltransferase [Chloroflexota bacterium]